MRNVRLAMKLLIGAILLVVVGYFVVINWSYVFSKTINGEIINVERVTDPSAILSARVSESQIHSYAVMIQGDDGVLYTSSSDDQQWQVTPKGYCVQARLYRNPPWNFDRANTFFNARVLQVSRCPGKDYSGSSLPSSAPTNPPAATESAPAGHQ